MDRRTKLLGSLFGLVIAGTLIGKVAYPRWIEPLLTLDGRVARAQKVLDELVTGEQKVLEAKYAFRAYAERIGSFDPATVENSLRERLNTLIAEHHLQAANTSPSRDNRDRKTGLVRKAITVQGLATLENAVGLLRSVAELPQVLRVVNPALYPARGGRGDEEELVNVRVPIEFMVLSQSRQVGKLQPADLRQPERIVRHFDLDYSHVWARTPLTEHRPPPPLQVQAGRDVKVATGIKASLQGSVTGGDGDYMCQWEPADVVSSPTDPRSSLDTSNEGTHSLTLTCRDGSGQQAKSSLTVTFEPRTAQTDAQPAARDLRWADRRYRQLCMSLLSTEGDGWIGEVLVYNTKVRRNEFYRVGDEFDGGKLVFVHQRGGLVRREGEYFVYPIGARLDEDIKLAEAIEFPRLQEVAQLLQAPAASTMPQPTGPAVDVGPMPLSPQGAAPPTPTAPAPKGAVKQPGAAVTRGRGSVSVEAGQPDSATDAEKVTKEEGPPAPVGPEAP